MAFIKLPDAGVFSVSNPYALDTDLLQRVRQIIGQPKTKRTDTMSSSGYDTYSQYDICSSDARMHWLAIRLRVRDTDSELIDMGLEHISTHYTGGADKVFVFVVQDGKPVTLEDDASLFPSDKLITALRLIKK